LSRIDASAWPRVVSAIINAIAKMVCTQTNMVCVFVTHADVVTNELIKIKKIMRVIDGSKQWYTAPTLRPDRIDSMYSYGSSPNTDIAVYFQQLKAYYYNAREASSYDDMKHEGYIYPHAGMIGDISMQIKGLCEDVVEQGMAVKIYLDQMDLYIFDPMWVQSNTMLDIGPKDRKKVIAHMSELISQQRKKMDPARRI